METAMTLLMYQVLKTVTEQGSFRKAAELLGLTPSAISHAVASLEGELGFPVLNRSKSGVTLTDYGERLLPYVNAVLNSNESLQQKVAQFNGLEQGTVKLGCFSSTCTNWIPDILHSFHKLSPGIVIEVRMTMWYTGSRTVWWIWDFCRHQVQVTFPLFHCTKIRCCALCPKIWSGTAMVNTLGLTR